MASFLGRHIDHVQVLLVVVAEFSAGELLQEHRSDPVEAAGDPDV